MADRKAKKVKKTHGNGKIDITFLAFVLILLTIGLVMLFSASFANAYYIKNDSLYYIKRQLIFAILGVVAMLIISKIDYHILHKFSIPLYALSVLLLVVVLFCPPVNGARRWIPIGISFQPSEIAKFAIILLFAQLIAINHKKMGTFKYGVLTFVFLLAPILLLMYFEPHLSGMVLITLIACLMMFIGGTKIKWFAIGGAVAVAGLLVIIFSGGIEYALGRVQGWLDPFSDPKDSTYQTIQSLIAIGSGGLFGKGLGNSRQKYLFLPEPQNDFIFAIVCEELGFIGALIIIVLFGLLVWRGFVIAIKAPDKFGSMLAAGIVIQVGLQTLLNIAVVTNTMPNTGISLPFFSYGGTSLMMLLAQMGVVLSVSRQSTLKKQ